MSLQIRLNDLITAIGTDMKQFRVWLTGTSTGDLTGLTTTTKTSIIAAINEVKASATGSPPSSSETAQGVIEIATQAEVTTGTDDLRAVTPLKHRTDLNTYAQPKSTNLTNLAGFTTSTDGTLAANLDTVLATQKAVKAYADALLDANNAYQYKGALDASTNPNYPAASAGWTYKVTVAGKIGGASGVNVEVGDSVTCLVDGSVAGNQATVGANWLILQTNIDGAVVGPTASVDSAFAFYSGTTGKLIKDSGVTLDNDTALTANSATRIPTQAAVVGYTYSKTNMGDPETVLTSLYTAAKA